MGKAKNCRRCYYWIRDREWDKNVSVIDKRKMGYCHHDPPILCQNLIPAAIREHGLRNLKQAQEVFQIRPITEYCDFCSNFTPKDKKE